MKPPLLLLLFSFVTAEKLRGSVKGGSGKSKGQTQDKVG